jgi:hypothetical protein
VAATSWSSVAGPEWRVVLVMIASPAHASSIVVTVPSVVNSIRSNGSRSSTLHAAGRRTAKGFGAGGPGNVRRR